MRALMASVELGVRRVEEIVARFGADVVADALRQLLARTRNLVRAKLAETFAYGTHRFTDAIDSDGHGNGPFHIRFALTRERGQDGEDRFIFDATETDDQSPGPVNLLMNPGVPGMALGPVLPRRRSGPGVQRRRPAGARRGAAARGLAAVAALPRPARHARPDDDARAGGAERADQRRRRQGAGRPFGLRDLAAPPQRQGGREPFLMSDGIGVGYGARPYADGIDAVYFVAQENYPVEFLELGYPVRLTTYGIVKDSGGPGRYRGGCGIVREYEILADEAVLAVRIDGVKNPPWGIAGGMSGGTAGGGQSGTPKSACWRPCRTATCSSAATCCASRPAAAAATAIPSIVRRNRRVATTSSAALSRSRLRRGLRRRDPGRRARRGGHDQARRVAGHQGRAFHRTVCRCLG